MSTTLFHASTQDCLDIIITALEGGIGYWSKCDPLERDENLNYLRTRVFVPAEDGETGLKPEPEHDYTEEGGYFGPVDYVCVGTLTAASVRKALKDILKGDTEFPGLKGAVAAADYGDGDYDIDADLADRIVQVAIFGKEIYG